MSIEIKKESLVCPITRQIFCKPVVAPDSFTYEKSAIEDWLQHNNKSPVTNEMMESTTLVPNMIILNMVNAFLEKYPDEKEDQFVVKKKFRKYANEVNEIIQNKEFEKLFEYDDFRANMIDRLFIQELLKCNDEKIMTYFIDNCFPHSHIGDDDLIHYILESGVPSHLKKYKIDNTRDLDIKGDNKKRPIHSAIYGNDVEIIKYLIGKKIDIDRTDSCGNTPLHIAINHGYLEIINILVKNGADLNIRNNDGQTPLIIAIGKNLESVMFLIENGANPSRSDRRGNFPIHVACRDLRPDDFKKVYDCFKNQYQLFTNKGVYPIHLVCEYGDVEMFGMLLETGADPDVLSNAGKKIIHYASKNKSTEILQKLLEISTDPNLPDKDDKMPLHFACKRGNFESVKLLLDNGAKLEAITNMDWKPIHYACRYGNGELVSYLIEKGAQLVCNASIKNNYYSCVSLMLTNLDARKEEIIRELFASHKFDIIEELKTMVFTMRKF